AMPIGLEGLDPLVAAALGPTRSAALFGFVNVEEDHDGVVRRARAAYPTEDGRRHVSWAVRAASTVDPSGAGAVTDRFVIDSRLDWRDFERISWKEAASAIERAPER